LEYFELNASMLIVAVTKTQGGSQMKTLAAMLVVCAAIAAVIFTRQSQTGPANRDFSPIDGYEVDPAMNAAIDLEGLEAQLINPMTRTGLYADLEKDPGNGALAEQARAIVEKLTEAEINFQVRYGDNRTSSTMEIAESVRDGMRERYPLAVNR
jgi:hypothetical protein